MARVDLILKTGSGRLRLAWRLVLFVALFGALFLGGLVALGGPGITAQGTAALLAGLVAGWALLALERRGPGALGFYLGRSAPGECASGLILGVGVGLLTVALMGVLGAVRFSADEGHLGQWLAVGATSLTFFVIPAASEEVLFRGYPLQALAESWGKLPALLTTSVGFGLMHAWNPNLTAIGVFNIAAAGAFLGALYLKTASLWLATAAHVGWNWAHGFVVDLPVSGLELVNTPIIDSVPTGPTWLGGGRFGPEGSVCASVVLIVSTIVLWRTPRLRPTQAALSARPLMEGGYG
jgi:membrane protease YdiL (CAAX protease family)